MEFPLRNNRTIRFLLAVLSLWGKIVFGIHETVLWPGCLSTIILVLLKLQQYKEKMGGGGRDTSYCFLKRNPPLFSPVSTSSASLA